MLPPHGGPFAKISAYEHLDQWSNEQAHISDIFTAGSKSGSHFEVLFSAWLQAWTIGITQVSWRTVVRARRNCCQRNTQKASGLPGISWREGLAHRTSGDELRRRAQLSATYDQARSYCVVDRPGGRFIHGLFIR